MIGQEEKQAVIDLFPFMGENPVVFDVGSNKGHFSDIILDEFKENCELHLFEPNIKLLSFTEIKYEYNQNIKYFSLPLYKEVTTIPFYYFENYNNELSSIYEQKWEGLPVRVKSTSTATIDGYCKMKGIGRIDYLKIDCEGADFDVLLGAKKMMVEDKVGIIQVEYSEALWAKANHTFKEFREYCEGLGYDVVKYLDGNFYKMGTDDAITDNYYVTKYDLHNYTGVDTGWASAFKESVKGLPKFNLMIEVGAFEGMTTKYMCENMLDDSGESRVIVIDPLMDVYVKGDTSHPYFKNQYQRFKRNTRGLPIELMRGDSQDELPKLHALRADFIYLDGNHHPPYPYLDACWCFAILKEGGYLLFDDYLWNDETKKCIDEWLEEYKKYYEVVKIDYQVLIRKTMNYYNEITESYYL